MTTTLPTPATALDPQALRTLAAQPGPCITIAIPGHRPGAAEPAPQVVFKNVLQEVARELPDYVADLTAPLEDLADSPLFDAGGEGWVIFRAPLLLTCYRARVENAQWDIGPRFVLAPFAAEAGFPKEFHALVLNTKRLRLFEYATGTAREVDWPSDIPATLERLDARLNNDLQSHSSGTQFGTGTEAETAQAHRHDFFAAVDRGLKAFGGRKPLVVIGVAEELAAYLHAAKHRPALLAGDPGNAEFLTAAEIGEMARAALWRDYERAGEAVLDKIHEQRDRSRAAVVVEGVVQAAAQGRVHHLCARASGWTGAQDPVNAAVVETLRHGGDEFVLTGDRLPADQPLAAVLRY